MLIEEPRSRFGPPRAGLVGQLHRQQVGLDPVRRSTLMRVGSGFGLSVDLGIRSGFRGHGALPWALYGQLRR